VKKLVDFNYQMVAKIHTHMQVFKYISDWSEWFLPEPTMNLTSHSRTGYIFAHRSLGASLWPPELFDATHECTRATYTIAIRERIRRMHIICSRIIKNTSVLFSQATAHRPADERGGRYLWKQRDAWRTLYATSPLTVNRTLSVSKSEVTNQTNQNRRTCQTDEIDHFKLSIWFF